MSYTDGYTGTHHEIRTIYFWHYRPPNDRMMRKKSITKQKMILLTIRNFRQRIQFDELVNERFICRIDEFRIYIYIEQIINKGWNVIAHKCRSIAIESQPNDSIEIRIKDVNNTSFALR